LSGRQSEHAHADLNRIRRRAQVTVGLVVLVISMAAPLIARGDPLGWVMLAFTSGFLFGVAVGR